MRLSIIATVAAALAACTEPGPMGADPSDEVAAASVRLGALESERRTIPYGGYVDFDDEPVNAGNVKFNFALFPCASPGTGASGCDALWVANGVWNNNADWTQGWPVGANDVRISIFTGRFSVELGAEGQNPLPAGVFEPTYEALYLGIQIEGRAMGSLQRIVPAYRAFAATSATHAAHATHADSAVTASESDRLRISAAIELDDAGEGRLPIEVRADDGLRVRELGDDVQREDAPIFVVEHPGFVAPPTGTHGGMFSVTENHTEVVGSADATPGDVIFQVVDGVSGDVTFAVKAGKTSVLNTPTITAPDFVGPISGLTGGSCQEVYDFSGANASDCRSLGTNFFATRFEYHDGGDFGLTYTVMVCCVFTGR